MAISLPPELLVKIRKLAQLAVDLRRGGNFPITRLTILKSLCQDPAVAHRFVNYLAQKTWDRVKHGKGHSRRRSTRKNPLHRQMMTDALAGMEAWLHKPNEALRHQLGELLQRMQAEQNEQKPIPFGAMRIIHDWDLLLLEEALHCLLDPPHAAGQWVYRMARDYAEKYDSRFPSGLTLKSAPFVHDLVDFWADVYGVDLASTIVPKKKRDPKMTSPDADEDMAKKAKFTDRQGQFLAFIHLFRKLHRQGPAELDMAKFFRVTPPSVHGMVVKLEELGLIVREPGVARSIRAVIPANELPELDNTEGPPW